MKVEQIKIKSYWQIVI